MMYYTLTNEFIMKNYYLLLVKIELLLIILLLGSLSADIDFILPN